MPKPDYINHSRQDHGRTGLAVDGIAIELLGTKRVMFGGHRPISRLARRMARPYEMYVEMTEGRSDTDRDAMFRGNAARWFWGGLDRQKVRCPESA